MLETNFTLSDDEFSKYRKLVYDLLGISLNESKKMLLISRVSKRLRILKLNSFQKYYDFIIHEKNAEELSTFMNLITTNKTDFFREHHHFEALKDLVLPERLECLARKEITNIRIWSSASSTGEEPYTIAMTILEFFQGKPKPDIKILATDIDTSVLEKAQAGIYKIDKAQEIPPELLRKYFISHKDGNFEARDSLKELITYGAFNLMNDFPFKYGFDMVFCRNVLIYFTPEDRKTIVRKIIEKIRPNGYLALGHSESMVVEGLALRTKGPTLYKKEYHA